MIPQIIQIKNFLSYGPHEQTINFTPYHLIYLSGKNGHGKSALLDAITWAVWGQARKTSGVSKADEGLVHLGQKHMLIIFEFVVNAQRYKIRREYIKTASKPYASLDFCIMQEDNSYKTLTDKTIGATQKKIEDTIGITYDTFVNSVFLRQGQSNEFSKKTPKERKEILANILHLEKFEALKKIASEKLKAAELSLLQQQTMTSRIHQELEELQTKISILTQQTAQHETLQQSINTHTEQKKNLNDQLTLVNKELETLQAAQIQHNITQSQLQQLEIQSKQLEEKIQQTVLAAKKMQEYTHIQTEYEQVRCELELAQKKATTRIELKEKFLELQTKKQQLEKKYEQEESQQEHLITVALASCTTTIAQLQEKIVQLHTKKIEHQKSYQTTTTLLEQAQAFLAQHANITEILKLNNHTVEVTQQELSTAQAMLQQLQTEQQQIQEKIALLKNNSDQTCQLCKQSVSTMQAEQMLTSFENEQKEIAAKTSTLQQHIKSLQHAVVVAKTEYNSLQQLYTTYVTRTHEQEQLTKELQKLHEQITVCNQEQLLITTELNATSVQEQKHRTDLAQLQLQSSSYKNNAEFQALEKALAEIIMQGKELGYDQQQHLTLQEKCNRLELLLKEFATVGQELALQQERAEQLNQLQLQIGTIHQQQKDLQSTILNLQPLVQQKNSYLEQITTVEATVATLQQEFMRIQQAHGSLQTEQAKQQKLNAERATLAAQSITNQQEITVLQTIIKTVSKEGVQALLIEQAIPEIEEEANFLLAELTNNQTQIFIESLRDLKKGGSKETLDIKISDALGVRPYEMFSGGEAFRIDFALRIAISKLLARRAGTTLQTLIIDEGFGSQDEEGLQVMMDCITKIQDHFAKIIVISHLPEMKEQFPVQFHVTKKSHGSYIDIIMH